MSYMYPSQVAHGIAAQCALTPTAQAVIAETSELHMFLASNRTTDLDPLVWKKMYAKKPLPPVELAQLLLDRPLTAEQLDHVIAVENRAKPLSVLVTRHLLSQAQMEKLIANKKSGPSVAGELIELGVLMDAGFDETFRRHLVGVAGGDYVLARLGTDPSATEAEARSVLSQYSEWKGKTSKARRRKLSLIVERFPRLLDVCVAPGAPVALVATACSSRHLTDEQLQHQALADPRSRGDDIGVEFAFIALANLPVAHRSTVEMISKMAHMPKASQSANDRLAKFSTRPTVTARYEEEENPFIVEWLLKRALSFRSNWDDRFTPAKPFELIAISANPLVANERDVRKVLDDLSSYDVRDAAGQLADAAHDALIARLGMTAPALDTFEQLAPYASNIRPTEGTYHPSGDPQQGAKAKVSTLRGPYATNAHRYVESVNLSADQWRVLLQLAPMMEEVTVEELVAAAACM